MSWSKSSSSNSSSIRTSSISSPQNPLFPSPRPQQDFTLDSPDSPSFSQTSYSKASAPPASKRQSPNTMHCFSSSSPSRSPRLSPHSSQRSPHGRYSSSQHRSPAQRSPAQRSPAQPHGQQSLDESGYADTGRFRPDDDAFARVPQKKKMSFGQKLKSLFVPRDERHDPNCVKIEAKHWTDD